MTKFNIHHKNRRAHNKIDTHKIRLYIFEAVLILIAVAVVARLFILQVIDGTIYREIAFGGRELLAQLEPQRGEIYMQSFDANTEVPLVLNQDRFLVYADGRYLVNPQETADKITEIMNSNEDEVKKISRALTTAHDDPYVPLYQSMSEFEANLIKDLDLDGIGFIRNSNRFYPEGSLAGHVTGFYGIGQNEKRIGQYGLEGFFEQELQGAQGQLVAERDRLGAWIPLSERNYKPSINGAKIVVTLDRAIQKFACDTLVKDARAFKAQSATLIIMDPKTGYIQALCNTPSFDPNTYAQTPKIEFFNNNAIFTPYEPGSVFKPITMAAAIDMDAVTPTSVFHDTGATEVEDFTIRNAGNKSYGDVTMREVLIESINTGMIYVAKSIGHEKLAEYIEKFGYGKVTGVQLDTENTGTIENAYKKGDVFLATTSFGQGITATPMQLITSYVALANQGKLMKPTIIERIEYANGEVTIFEPNELRQVISPRSSAQISSMLESVVSQGHAKSAGVPEYLIAGKTGTAQIADDEGGYGEFFNHTFIGYGPADDARFVMLVKYEKPEPEFSASTAAVTFGKVARFLVDYFNIQPDY